jgi:hypothetical protein
VANTIVIPRIVALTLLFADDVDRKMRSNLAVLQG